MLWLSVYSAQLWKAVGGHYLPPGRRTARRAGQGGGREGGPLQRFGAGAAPERRKRKRRREKRKVLQALGRSWLKLHLRPQLGQRGMMGRQTHGQTR